MSTIPYFDRKYTCPICNMEFTSLAVRSSMTYVEKRESDFHTIYKGISPLHYSMIVCPICNYAASTSMFPKPLSPRQAEQLGKALLQLKDNDINFGLERDENIALRSFQLAVRTAQLKKVSAGELGGLLLSTAWMAREIGDREMEETYLKEALASYLSAFETGSASIGNLTDIQAMYLIGELYRRCGNYSEAVNWFNNVIVHKNIKQYPAEEKMAREQWSLAREQLKDLPEPDNISAVPDNSQRKISPPGEKPETIEKGFAPAKKRLPMQMPASVYSDQVDWLTRVVNNGYNYSKHLVTKEQVVRSMIDAVMEVLGDDLPDQFASEDELRNELVDRLKRQPAC